MGAMAATPALVTRLGGYPSFCNARWSPLYQLLEAYYEDVKAVWEERFEKNYARFVIMQSRERQLGE